MNIDRMVDPGGILCIGAKWLGERETIFLSDWEHGQQGMAQAILELLTEAEGVITYNGDKFDLPKIRGFLAANGLDDFPPVTSIDLYKTVRGLGYASNRLGFIAPYLGLGNKVSHEGFDLWVKVMVGNEAARRRMERYCIGDVKLTEKLYRRIKPFIRNHPHFGTNSQACGACGSKVVEKRGYRRTKYYITQRLKCKRCGGWSTGTRKRIH